MKKEKALKVLMEEGRYTYTVEFAKEVAKAFGLELDESLIRTSLGYREYAKDENKPRVSINSLARSICEKLGFKPNEKTMKKACAMCGEGSYRDLSSQAYAEGIEQGLKVPALILEENKK